MVIVGLFRCQQCLELGAGVGVTAVVLARVIEAARSAAKVTTTDQTASGSLIATDYAPVILDNLKHNLEISMLCRHFFVCRCLLCSWPC